MISLKRTFRNEHAVACQSFRGLNCTAGSSRAAGSVRPSPHIKTRATKKKKKKKKNGSLTWKTQGGRLNAAFCRARSEILQLPRRLQERMPWILVSRGLSPGKKKVPRPCLLVTAPRDAPMTGSSFASERSACLLSPGAPP